MMNRLGRSYPSNGPGVAGDAYNVGVNFGASPSGGGALSVQVTGIMLLALVGLVVWGARSL